MRRALLLLSLLSAAQLAAQTPAYRITHTYPLGGDGSWDYLVPDAARHRVFIGRHDRVMVVDETNGKLLGEVPEIHGAHAFTRPKTPMPSSTIRRRTVCSRSTATRIRPR